MSVHRYGDDFCRGFLNYSGLFVCTQCSREIVDSPFIVWMVSEAFARGEPESPGVPLARALGARAREGRVTTHIALHPACALDLSVRILRDVHEIECRANLHAELVPDEGAIRDPQRPRV